MDHREKGLIGMLYAVNDHLSSRHSPEQLQIKISHHLPTQANTPRAFPNKYSSFLFGGGDSQNVNMFLISSLLYGLFPLSPALFTLST